MLSVAIRVFRLCLCGLMGGASGCAQQRMLQIWNASNFIRCSTCHMRGDLRNVPGHLRHGMAASVMVCMRSSNWSEPMCCTLLVVCLLHHAEFFALCTALLGWVGPVHQPARSLLLVGCPISDGRLTMQDTTAYQIFLVTVCKVDLPPAAELTPRVCRSLMYYTQAPLRCNTPLHIGDQSQIGRTCCTPTGPRVCTRIQSKCCMQLSSSSIQA